MRNFLLGVIVTVLIIIVGGAGLALLGFLPTNANADPPRWERHIANIALDNSMEKHAPRVNNPVPPTDENLIDGMKIYSMNCSVCHGGLDKKPAMLTKSLYPPAPNLMLHAIDDPEWHVFYVIRTGVRYTAMPSWEKALSESDSWKLTAFLTRVEKLPPAVQDFWQKSTGVAAPVEGENKPHDHNDHDH